MPTKDLPDCVPEEERQRAEWLREHAVELPPKCDGCGECDDFTALSTARVCSVCNENLCSYCFDNPNEPMCKECELND